MFHFFGGVALGFLYTLLSLGVYLLGSYSIYRLAYVRNLPNPIFAFIPFFQLFMLGQIGDTLKYHNKHLREMLGSVPLAYAMPLLSIFTSILASPFNTITSFLVMAAEVAVYYLVFDYYTPKYCALFTLLSCSSVFFALLQMLRYMPIIGSVLSIFSGLLGILAAASPLIGPLLVIYAVKGYRNYY